MCQQYQPEVSVYKQLSRDPDIYLTCLLNHPPVVLTCLLTRSKCSYRPGSLCLGQLIAARQALNYVECRMYYRMYNSICWHKKVRLFLEKHGSKFEWLRGACLCGPQAWTLMDCQLCQLVHSWHPSKFSKAWSTVNNNALTVLYRLVVMTKQLALLISKILNIFC